MTAEAEQIATSLLRSPVALAEASAADPIVPIKHAMLVTACNRNHPPQCRRVSTVKEKRGDCVA